MLFDRILGGNQPEMGMYPLVNKQFAIENDHLLWIFPLNMVSLHSYVSVPEGNM